MSGTDSLLKKELGCLLCVEGILVEQRSSLHQSLRNTHVPPPAASACWGSQDQLSS